MALLPQSNEDKFKAAIQVVWFLVGALLTLLIIKLLIG